MSPQSPSPRRVVSAGDSRIVVQGAIQSAASLFHDFDNSTFVDKTLAIEAFLRYGRAHHLILRPRRCGKTFTLSMIQEFLQHPLKSGSSLLRDISTTRFAGTAIAACPNIVSKHFQQYPILHIDLKDVAGSTYDEMLTSFDAKICQILDHLSYPNSDLMHDDFCINLRKPEALQGRRCHALNIIAWELQRVYGKPVVVLVDEYDAPMHCAIEHGYSTSANTFFGSVFASLLKNNGAVYASMMVGICEVKKSGWLSSLNNVRTFPMHAVDDRYARFFLFTEEEVEILLDESHDQLSLESLQEHFNGYTARYSSGLIKLYNPLSVVKALERNKISDYWIETGQYSSLSRSLWHTSDDFHANIVLLLMEKCVELVIDEHIDYSSYDTISDSGLWGLLYYAGYLSIESFGDPSLPEYIFRIPNREVASQWRGWIKDHLVGSQGMTTRHLSDLRNTILDGNANGF